MNDYHFSEIELQRRRNAEISDEADMDENSSQFLRRDLGARVKKAFWAKMARIIDSSPNELLIDFTRKCQRRSAGLCIISAKCLEFSAKYNDSL